MKKKPFYFLLLTFCFLFSACGAPKTPVTAPTPAAKAGLTMAVVAEHSSSTDCWLVINNNIYNVTDYLPNHPGGDQHIVAYCGKDATTAFETKGGTGGTHSDAARAILAQFYIGDLAR